MLENQNSHVDIDSFCWKTTYKLFSVTVRLISNHNERVSVITAVFANKTQRLKQESEQKEDTVKQLQSKLND